MWGNVQVAHLTCLELTPAASTCCYSRQNAKNNHSNWQPTPLQISTKTNKTMNIKTQLCSSPLERDPERNFGPPPPSWASFRYFGEQGLELWAFLSLRGCYPAPGGVHSRLVLADAQPGVPNNLPPSAGARSRASAGFLWICWGVARVFVRCFSCVQLF